MKRFIFSENSYEYKMLNAAQYGKIIVLAGEQYKVIKWNHDRTIFEDMAGKKYVFFKPKKQIGPFENITSVQEISWSFQEPLAHIVGDLEEIKKLNPDQIMSYKLQWVLGNPTWWKTIKDWIIEAGFEINTKQSK